MPKIALSPLLILFTLSTLSMAAAATSSPPPPTLRLPAGVRPLGYAIHLKLVPGEKSFSGEVDVELQLDSPTDRLWLNGSHDLTLESASITQESRPEQRASAISPSGSDFISFQFGAPLLAGNARLHIRYTGRLLRHEGVGLFDEQDGHDDYIFSDFEPFDARRAFPCFDEPSFKVPVQFTLDVPAQHLAATNAPIESEQPLPDGLRRVVFKRTAPLPTYLWALAVGPFESVDAGQGGSRHVPLRILTMHGRAAEGKEAATVTAPLIDLLERYTGVPYPYEKLDEVGVPNQSHAMENAGLITYGQRLIQLGPGNDTVASRRRFARVCAHELAHHWTGDLVTLRYWDDLWLNESFASFLGSKVTEQFKPDWGEKLDRVLRRQDAMNTDSLLSARRIRQPIATSDDIVNAFDVITYAKGQSVLTMIESWLGETTFAHGLNRYLRAHENGNAAAQDFISALADETTAARHPEQAAALPKVLESFLNQPGAPVVSLALSCDGGSARLRYRQRRYLSAGVQPPAGEQNLYHLPLCIEVEGAGRRCLLLDAAAGEVPLGPSCPRYVQADPDVSAYARVSYEGELLDRILERGFPQKEGAAKMSSAQQLALLLDLDALVHSGDLPVDRVLPVVARAAALQNRYLVSAAVRIVYGLREIYPESEKPNRHWAALVRSLFSARLEALGLKSRPQEDEEGRLLRATLLPLVLGDGEVPALQAQAEALITAWLTDPKQLDDESSHALLTATAQRAGAKLWQALRQAAVQEKDHNRRSLLLEGLGAVRNPALAQQSLSLMLGGQFEMREAMKLLWGVASHPETRPVAYAFVKQHFDELQSKLPRDGGASLARVAAGFCDEAQRSAAESFFTGRSTKYVGGPRVLRQTLEHISQCSYLRQAQGSRLTAFVSRY